MGIQPPGLNACGVMNVVIGHSSSPILYCHDGNFFTPTELASVMNGLYKPVAGYLLFRMEDANNNYLHAETHTTVFALPKQDVMK